MYSVHSTMVSNAATARSTAAPKRLNAGSLSRSGDHQSVKQSLQAWNYHPVSCSLISLVNPEAHTLKTGQNKIHPQHLENVCY